MFLGIVEPGGKGELNFFSIFRIKLDPGGFVVFDMVTASYANAMCKGPFEIVKFVFVIGCKDVNSSLEGLSLAVCWIVLRYLIGMLDLS